MKLPTNLQNVIEQFSKLPGVGEKTATRQALIMANWDAEELMAFGESVSRLSMIQKCSICGLLSDENKCSICTDESRSYSRTICVVESTVDCLAIEKSDQFKGRYHVLGGVLNPLLGVGPEELNLNLLLERIDREEVNEIIFAINPSVEGDATCSYIKQILPDSVKVERIGFGMPMGGSLEYLDPLTINMAFTNRQEM